MDEEEDLHEDEGGDQEAEHEQESPEFGRQTEQKKYWIFFSF